MAHSSNVVPLVVESADGVWLLGQPSLELHVLHGVVPAAELVAQLAGQLRFRLLCVALDDGVTTWAASAALASAALARASASVAIRCSGSTAFWTRRSTAFAKILRSAEHVILGIVCSTRSRRLRAGMKLLHFLLKLPDAGLQRGVLAVAAADPVRR